MPGRPGVQQDVEGCAKTCVAGGQRRVRLDVAGRDVVKHDNVRGNFLIVGQRFAAMADSISFMLAWTCSTSDMRSDTMQL
jgi:hypothetical protein